MNILFVSDYVCPYCLVAKEALKQALARTGLQPDIIWQPFELTQEPNPRPDTYHDKVRRSHYTVLEEPCRQLGLDMKLPPNVVPRPYSRLAFEGYYYALAHGVGDAYNDLMYRAYFIEELDIGSLDVLCGLAARVGLDAADYRKALEDGVYAESLKEANRFARQELAVKHVPTIYLDGAEISLQEYTADEFVALLTAPHPAEENGAGNLQPQAGCNGDTCTVPIRPARNA